MAKIIKIISLGKYTIQFGAEGDPERIRKMIGGFYHWLSNGLDPNRFAVSENDPERWRERAGIEGWPEGEKRFELFAVNFGIWFPNF